MMSFHRSLKIARRSAVLAIAILGVTTMSSSLIAQQRPDSMVASVAAAHVVTVHAPAVSRTSTSLPRLIVSGLDVRTRFSSDSLPARAAREDAHIGVGSNLALMGVGAAGVVVGLLVGGNGGAAIAVGGGALGLYGLYRYLR